MEAELRLPDGSEVTYKGNTSASNRAFKTTQIPDQVMAGPNGEGDLRTGKLPGRR